MSRFFFISLVFFKIMFALNVESYCHIANWKRMCIIVNQFLNANVNETLNILMISF